MTRPAKDKRYILFALLFVASILPFAGRLFDPGEKKVEFLEDEQFEPALARLNSMDKVIAYADSLYSARHLAGFDTVAYAHTLGSVIKKRFYHGLSHYNASENWIAYLAGKTLWYHLSAKVNPEDILKNSHGLCSQQSIVFMEALHRKGITSRTVGLGYKEGPGHFLTEIYYGSEWHLYDVTVEPKWAVSPENKHKSMAFYTDHKDVLAAIYEGKIPKNIFDKIIQKVSYGEPDEFPAKKMRLFHQATGLATYVLPLFFLFLSIRSYRKKIARKRAMPPNTEHITPAPLIEEEPAVVLQ